MKVIGTYLHKSTNQTPLCFTTPLSRESLFLHPPPSNHARLGTPNTYHLPPSNHARMGTRPGLYCKLVHCLHNDNIASCGGNVSCVLDYLLTNIASWLYRRWQGKYRKPGRWRPPLQTISTDNWRLRECSTLWYHISIPLGKGSIKQLNFHRGGWVVKAQFHLLLIKI